MTIEGYIINALSKKEKVVITGLGTFTVTQQPAEIGHEGEVIAPPSTKVSFNTDILELDQYSLTSFIANKENCPLPEAEQRIVNFVQTTKEDIELHDMAELHGLGTLHKGEYGDIYFEMYEGTNLMPNSFGLPKLSAYPISKNTPATTQKAGGSTKELNLTLWAILIPVIILAVIGGYLFFNNDTYEALFSNESAQTQQSAPSQQAKEMPDPQTDPDPEKPVNNTSENQQAKETTPTQNNNDTPKKAAETPSNPKSETKENTAENSKTELISAPTSRFYIILGSFSTIANAKEGRQKMIAKGYANAKVVNSDGKIRLSANDFGTKNAADQEVRIVRQDFPDAWILAY